MTLKYIYITDALRTLRGRFADASLDNRTIPTWKNDYKYTDCDKPQQIAYIKYILDIQECHNLDDNRAYDEKHREII